MPKRLLFIAIGMILASGACDRPTRSARLPTSGKVLTVMTFNVNFGLGGDAASIAAIRGSGADLVLLQETTEEWERQIRRQLAGVYPHMAFRHCCGAGGLAILSKGALVRSEYLDARKQDRGWFPAWRHVVKTPLGNIQTLNVHLRPQVSSGGSVVRGYFSTPPVRRKEIEAFVASLDDSLPTVIAGDFNESKDGRAVQYLRSKGLRTALPEFDPGADTWKWQTSVGTIHSQLDHVVYDPQLVPLNAAVLKQGSSDHWPVVVTFERAR